MRKHIIFLLFAFILFGCTRTEPTYSFPNRDVEIISIELLSNPNHNTRGEDGLNMTLLRTLIGDEIPAFMEQCYDLPTSRMGTPPSTWYGPCVAKIYYVNGDIEIFSTYNIELIPAGSKPLGCGTHCFLNRTFDQVFAQYTEAETGDGSLS